MRRLSLILGLPLLLILGLGVQAEAKTMVTPLEYSRTETVRDLPASLSLHMPFMISADHPLAAKRMNEVMYAKLSRIWPETTIGGTKNVLNHAEIMGQTTIDQFRIIRNDDNVVSLIIHGSFCGANCTDMNFRYSFDARTGRALELEQLVDNRGRAIIARSIQVHDLQRVHDSYALLSPSDESYAEKRKSYRNCLEELRQNDRLPDLLVGREGLSFERNDLCEFPHVIAAWDLNARDVFSANQLGSHLTPYGRSLLLEGSPRVQQPTPNIPQQSALLCGTIGDHLAILLILDKQQLGSREITGSYAYRQPGEMIDLSGTLIGTHLHLVEEHGVIDATFQGNSLIGSWHNATRSYPFRAEVQ